MIDRAFTIDLETGDIDPMPTAKQRRAAWAGWLDRNSTWTRAEIDAMADRELAVNAHGIAGNLDVIHETGESIDDLEGVHGFGGAS